MQESKHNCLCFISLKYKCISGLNRRNIWLLIAFPVVLLCLCLLCILQSENTSICGFVFCGFFFFFSSVITVHISLCVFLCQMFFCSSAFFFFFIHLGRLGWGQKGGGRGVGEGSSWWVFLHLRTLFLVHDTATIDRHFDPCQKHPWAVYVLLIFIYSFIHFDFQFQTRHVSLLIVVFDFIICDFWYFDLPTFIFMTVIYLNKLTADGAEHGEILHQYKCVIQHWHECTIS